MPQFLYKARDGSGELTTGTVEAATLQAAGVALRSQGKFVIKLDPVRGRRAEAPRPGSRAASADIGSNKRVKRDEVITFAHQLAVMVDTGVPISEAMECVAEQTANEAFREVVAGVAGQVQAGTELSVAMSGFPKVFPPIMVSLIRASEMSGTMGPMLEVISRYLSKERATAKKIKGAITYPAVMLVMVIGVTIFLLTFVMPRFASIYQSKDAALPAPTRLLMAVSDALIHHWVLICLGLVVGITTLIVWAGSASGRRAFDYLKLNTPVIGKLFRQLYITRAARTMGTMIAAGVPILDMIGIVRAVTRNSYYEELWDRVDDQLRKGSQLSEPLFNTTLFPRSVAQMIYAGEKSGRLGDVVDKIAAYTEEDFDEQIKQTTQYIEPLLVATMGAIIGFVAIALLLPIFQIGTVMSH